MPDRIDDAARALVSGQEVDWPAVAAAADSEQERRWLRNLQMVQRLAAVHRDDDGARTAQLESPTSAAIHATPTLRIWGHLNLLEKIGRGGFGDVYRAWDGQLNRAVALKLLREDVEAIGAADRDQVLREARLLARVEHPNVARVYGVQQHAGRAGIWMELVEGTDLRTLVLEGTPLPPRDAARVTRDIADALAAVHARDVVHQDVKPENVVVRDDGRVVLMDFGAGRRRRFEGQEGPRLVAGTPLYLAPETLLHEAPPSPSSDIYALGCTLYFLLSGGHPVEGDLTAICAAHAEGRRRPLEERAPEVPAPLREIVEKCLAPRAERTARVASVRDALDRYLATTRRRRSRLRWLLPVAAVLALASVAVWRTRPPDPVSGQVQLASLGGGAWRPLELNAQISSADEVELKLQLNRSAYVYVLNRDARGETVVLFPMAGSSLTNPLPGGRPISLPGVVDGERLGWAFSPVPGAEDFLVIASAQPLAELEAELHRVASVDLGSGLTVRPLAGEEFDVVMRGVIGVVRVDETEPEPGDPFAVAHRLADQSRALWVHHLRLQNAGQ